MEEHFTKTGTTYVCDRCEERVTSWDGNPGDWGGVSASLMAHRMEHLEADVAMLIAEREERIEEQARAQAFAEHAVMQGSVDVE